MNADDLGADFFDLEDPQLNDEQLNRLADQLIQDGSSKSIYI